MMAKKISSDEVILRSPIKTGGQAVIYSGQLFNKEELVAVKIYNNEPIYFDFFMREVELLANISSKYIPFFYGHYQTSTELGIVLEYLEGANWAEILLLSKDLDIYMRNTVLRYFIIDIVSAIKFLNNIYSKNIKSVAHGDLSPENIFLTKDGRLMLLDLGAATIRGRPAYGNKIFGKRSYLAPEQLAGMPASIKSDLYAFGALCFETLCLRRFNPEHYSADFSFLKECLGEENRDLFLTIRACLAPSPKFRPKNAKQLLLFINPQTDEDAAKAKNYLKKLMENHF